MKTLILGATPNPERFAYLAADRLTRYGHEIVNVGIKSGSAAGVDILPGQPALEDIDTVTLYLGARHQAPYYDWLLDLAPRRIIFNPGTENPELARLARARGIETEVACTLVMLGSGTY